MSLVLQAESGTITVPDSVLVDIAARAAERVEGVRVRRRRTVDVEARIVRLGLAAHPNEPLTTVGERVQEEVAAAFRTMCGLELTVDVAIEELT